MAEYDKILHPEQFDAMDNLTLDPFCMAAFETWLEDRAKEGWQVNEVGARLTDFVKAEPKPTRYRLTPLPRREKEPEPDFLDMAAAAGWEYVTTVHSAFHLWRCDDPLAPEMENDPVAQAEGYRYLSRRMTRDMVILAALFLLLPSLLVAFAWKAPLLALTRMAPGWLASMVLYFGGGAWLAVRQWRRLRRQLHQLRTGIPLDRPVPWKRERLIRRLALFVGIPLYFWTLFGDDFLDDGWSIRNNADAVAKARYVDVTELNPDISDDVELREARTKVTELVPRFYEVRQVAWEPYHGQIALDPGELAPTAVSADTAETGYYRLWTAGMAAELEGELAAGHEGRWYAAELETVATPDLDSFRWHRYGYGEETDRQYAVARLGNAVLWVDYHGPADLRQETEYLASLLR